MARETVNGVSQYYGPRNRHEGVGGTQGTRDDVRQLVLYIGGADYLQAKATLPAGATIVGNALVEVTEAFVLGGTTPVINIGVVGSEATNYLASITEAQAEAVGTYSKASAGTLAKDTPLASAVTIGVALAGTTPTITGAGKLKLVIPYKSI